MCRSRLPLQLVNVARLALADQRGITSIIFALLLVPICLALGLAVDYRRTSTLRNEMQRTADSAVLAAVAAAANGASPTDAEAAGTAYWTANANLLSNGQNNVGTPAWSMQSVNGVTTATLAFSGSQQTAFGSLLGITAMEASGSATAQSYQTVTRTNGLTGSGSVWGDPHISGADGNNYTINCPSGNWYDLLSDAGIEINISCFHTPTFTWELVNQVSVMIGSHTIQFYRPELDTALNPVSPFDASAFVLDGVTQNGTAGTTTSYLGGQVTYAYMEPSDWTNEYANVLTITTPVYTVTMSYGRYGMTVAIVATGAGLCGVPGGLWGNTLAGIDNSATGDFIVSGPTSTDYAFQRSSCTTASLGPHLIK